MPKQVIEEDDEDNWAASLDAYPDLTEETFNLFGGRNLSQVSANTINIHAGSVSGQQFGASTIREPENRPGQAYTEEGGWKESDDPHVPVYTSDPTPLIKTEERTTTTTPTITPAATTTSPSAATLIPSLEKNQGTPFQFNPQRTLLDASMIAGGQKRIFKLHFIYPKQASDEVAGKISENRPAGTGTGNYAWTGNWELSTKQMELLEERIRRSLGESGVTIAPGIDIQHSEKMVNDVRVNWDELVKELGIGNYEYDDETVPVYLIRGLGAYAGGSAGDNWSGSFLTMGDSVIESLAGFEGKTAYELIQNFEHPDANQDDHKFYASWQAQMGTVLHEGFHAVAALPHRTDAENPEGVLEKGMLRDYAENYGGAHGEEFAKAIDDAMLGKQGTDQFAALNIIMNQPWNYGWGQEGQEKAIVQPTSTTIPTSTEGPIIETVERKKAPRTEGPQTIQRTGMTLKTTETDTGGGLERPEFYTDRVTRVPSIETPNADIVNDMHEATRHVGSFRTGRTSRTGPERNIIGQNEMSIMPNIQDDVSTLYGLGLTEDPLIQTIPRLRGQ